MRRRILIIVGSLALLAVTWVVSWERYQKSQNFEQTKKEDVQKRTEKPIKYSRLPATKKNLNSYRRDGPVPLLLKEVAERNFKGFSVSKTKTFPTSKGSFSFVEDLKVVDATYRDQYKPEEIIEEKFNKLLVKGIPDRESGDRVVQNNRTKRLGILTGVFKIKLVNHDKWTELKDEHNLSLEANFAGIRLSLLKTTQTDQVEAILSSLSSDPRVERVELEILEDPPQSK